MYGLKQSLYFRVALCLKYGSYHWRVFYHSHSLCCCSQRNIVPEQYLELSKMTSSSSSSSRLVKRSNEKRLDKSSISKKEYLYGISPCIAALEANRRRFYAIYLNDDATNMKTRPQFKQIKYMAEKTNIVIKSVARRRLDDLCGNRPHQGMLFAEINIIMKVGNLSMIPLEKDNLKRDIHAEKPYDGANRPPLWLVLQGVQDPMNMGAILRTSAYLGVDKVVCSQSDSCPLTPAVSKASAGAMECLPLYSTNVIQLLKDKSMKNWEILGTVQPRVTPHGPRCTPVVPCDLFQLEKPSLLVLVINGLAKINPESLPVPYTPTRLRRTCSNIAGNEGSGLTDQAQALCTKFLTIQSQMRHSFGDLDSLNVSVAAGILLHSILSHENH